MKVTILATKKLNATKILHSAGERINIDPPHTGNPPEPQVVDVNDPAAAAFIDGLRQEGLIIITDPRKWRPQTVSAEVAKQVADDALAEATKKAEEADAAAKAAKAADKEAAAEEKKREADEKKAAAAAAEAAEAKEADAAVEAAQVAQDKEDKKSADETAAADVQKASQAGDGDAETTPTKSWSKPNIIAYLQRREIEHDPNIAIPKLLDQIPE